MEGGKTSLTGLCYSPLASHSSLDAALSVEGTAEGFSMRTAFGRCLGELKDGGKRKGETCLETKKGA